MMKNVRLLSFVLMLFTAIPSFGMCPTTPLRAFDEKMGFVDVVAFKDEKTGMTRFGVTMNPKTFLSHFKHAFPANRAQTRITLRAKNEGEFRGVVVEFGKVGFNDPDFTMRFEVPSTDLNRYELEFDCGITSGEDGIPVIGGEIFVATLQAFREAKSTMTETHPIWKELEEEHRKMLQQGDFGPDRNTKKAPSETGPGSDSNLRGSFGGTKRTELWDWSAFMRAIRKRSLAAPPWE